MLSGVQTWNGTPHDQYNIRGIAHAHTNRIDNIFMQRRLYIDEAHMALDIFNTHSYTNNDTDTDTDTNNNNNTDNDTDSDTLTDTDTDIWRHDLWHHNIWSHDIWRHDI